VNSYRHILTATFRFLSVCLILICLNAGVFYDGAEAAAPPVISASSTSGMVDTYLTITFSATCNLTSCTAPLVWSISGLIPPGMSASLNYISGEPTTAGSFPVNVQVTDGSGGFSEKDFTIFITVPALTFSTTSIPTAAVRQSYSASIVATGGTGAISYALTSGSLPSGLTFNNGQISGTPASGTSGSYSITVTATAGSSTAQQTFTLTVEKGSYDVTVSISSDLEEGQTRVYVDNVPRATLRGGESYKLTKLDPDTSSTVAVDNIVTPSGRTDIQYRAESSSATVSAGVSQLLFTYYPEYDIDITSSPVGITSVSGSGWHRVGKPLNISAPQEVAKDAESQYRFAYWLTPTGEKNSSATLNTVVESAGKYIATYDLYYRLTVDSKYGNTTGGGWQKAGSIAKWSVAPEEVAMPGIAGFFGGKFRALLTSGSALIEGPKTVSVQWDPDYSTPAVTIPITVLVIAGLIYGIYALTRRDRIPQPVNPWATQVQQQPPPPPPPPPPVYYPPYPPMPPPPLQPPLAAIPPQTTVVMIGEGLKRPQNTREQLMEKFGELLQKYEEELSQGRELPSPSMQELPEMATMIDKKELSAPDYAGAIDSTAERDSTVEECGSTSKKLLRSVVTQWKNAAIKPIAVIPGDKKSAAMAGGRTVTWTRESYNEWELHICKLPLGHKGMHKGVTEIVYSVLDSISEDRNYGPKQPLKPPIPHYTDGMPEINIPASQIIPPDQLPA